jgi:hypothetical protein
VSLDYFGIKSTHQPPIIVAANKIQLYAVVDDGKRNQKFSYPSGGEGLPMEDFHLQDLRRQTIFNTLSVGDYLRISIVAYSCEDKEAIAAIWKAIEAFQPGVRTLREFYENLPQKRERIGFYEHTWYPIDRWGIATSRYEEKDGDLLVWFRIWSNTEPPSTPIPTLLPDVKIQSVDLPSEVKRSAWPGLYTYPHTLTIVNNESISVKVEWQVNSSATGNFASDEVLVPANGHKAITIRPWYENPPGVVKITYTISYKGTELDSRSGTVNVIP